MKKFLVLLLLTCLIACEKEDESPMSGKITAQKENVPYNGNTVISWDLIALNADLVKICRGQRKKILSGIPMYSTMPTGILKSTTEYIIIYGDYYGKKDSCSVIVSVGIPVPPKITITPQNKKISGAKNSKVFFGWKTEGDDITTKLNGKTVPDSFPNFEHIVTKDTVFTITSSGPLITAEEKIYITCTPK